MWSKLKKYAAIPFLKDFLIISFLITLISVIIIPKPYNVFFSFIFLVIVISLSVFFVIRRDKEISAIRKTVSAIRNNSYSNPGDIFLGPGLQDLEYEIKLMFRKMQDDIEYLKKLERMRTEFLANVSHELRTPIFTVQGYLETLLEGAINDTEVNRKFLEKANQHTLNLSSLVNDLIDISMIESGEMRMSFRYFNINEFLSEIVNEMKSIAEEKKLQLVFVPARTNLMLLGDKIRLKQVMLNLITNAVKYTDKGGIDVFVEEGPRTAEIIVKDSGIGIAEEEKNRIFERFYRVDKARSRAVGGTGLGLAIVKHIIEAHGAKIRLNSRINEGSEFRFSLKK